MKPIQKLNELKMSLRENKTFVKTIEADFGYGTHWGVLSQDMPTVGG